MNNKEGKEIIKNWGIKYYLYEKENCVRIYSCFNKKIREEIRSVEKAWQGKIIPHQNYLLMILLTKHIIESGDIEIPQRL